MKSCEVTRSDSFVEPYIYADTFHNTILHWTKQFPRNSGVIYKIVYTYAFSTFIFLPFLLHFFLIKKFFSLLQYLHYWPSWNLCLCYHFLCCYWFVLEDEHPEEVEGSHSFADCSLSGNGLYLTQPEMKNACFKIIY